MKNQAALAFVTLLAGGAALAQSSTPCRPEFSNVKTIDSAPCLAGAPTEPARAAPTGSDASPVDVPGMDVRRMRAGTGTGLGRGRVYFDEPGDGITWAKGDAYKAGFGRDGATYIPFLGSQAPRNFPVAFHIASLSAGGESIAFDADVAPAREGNRVVFDRGSVLEVYDLAPGSIEQSFVFRSPLAGEIEIQLAVDTDLARARDGADLVLRAVDGEGELGSVRYGEAFAVDARLGRTALASDWNGDSIRIAVSAERVAQSAWPLVVDPVISTFAVDFFTEADILPDISWDEGTGYWIIVHERVFSSTDHDVFFHMGDANGPLPEYGYVDFSTSYWAAPKVANMNFTGRFLVVAAVGSPTGGARNIWSRIRSPTLGSAFEAPVQVNGTDLGDEHDPDIGGNPNASAGGHFCVVWQRDYASDDHDILARLVNPSGSAASNVIYVSNSFGTLDNLPAISKSCGLPSGLDDQRWNVAWQRFQGLSDNDVMVAQLHWDDGSLVLTPHYVQHTIANEYNVSVSSPTTDSTRKYMVVCTAMQALGDTDTTGYLVSGSSIVDSTNLTLYGGAPTGREQLNPSVDCDGTVFVYADQESVAGSSDYDVYVSTFHVIGTVLKRGEGHMLLGGSATPERAPEVSCQAASGGGPRRTLIVWSDQTIDGNGDIEAAYYDASPFATYCQPGVDGVVDCPCGNGALGLDRGCNNSANTAGARLTALGTVAPDTVQLVATDMQPTTTCLFVQGSLYNLGGIAFGDGVRCVTGNMLRLKTKVASAGTAAYPGSGDPSITQRAASLGAPISAGQDRYYFVYYRDLGASGCSATFNTTPSVRIRW